MKGKAEKWTHKKGKKKDAKMTEWMTQSAVTERGISGK
jgi:hypothetical protein